MNVKKLITLSLASLLTLSGSAAETLAASVDSTEVTKSTDTENDTERIQLVFEFQDGRISDQFESTLESLFPVDIVMDKVLSTNPYLSSPTTWPRILCSASTSDASRMMC